MDNRHCCRNFRVRCLGDIMSSKKYRVMMLIEEELYNKWKRHIFLNHGIKSAGAQAKIMEHNAHVFSGAIKKIMEEKK